jgi:hypothetical protein
MDIQMKKLAALVAAMGLATVGAVGAQIIEPTEPAQSIESVPQPAEAPIVLTDSTTTEALSSEAVIVDTIAANESQPMVIAQAEPAPAYVTTETVVLERTYVQAYSLPRSVSSRSGEDSGEEIAVRTAPVDVQAGMLPEKLTDQSPGV